MIICCMIRSHNFIYCDYQKWIIKINEMMGHKLRGKCEEEEDNQYFCIHLLCQNE